MDYTTLRIIPSDCYIKLEQDNSCSFGSFVSISTIKYFDDKIIYKKIIYLAFSFRKKGKKQKNIII
jgi:hypothetical protein